MSLVEVYVILLWAIGAGFILASLEGFREAVFDIEDVLRFVSRLVTALIVAGIGVAIFWMGWYVKAAY